MRFTWTLTQGLGFWGFGVQQLQASSPPAHGEVDWAVSLGLKVSQKPSAIRIPILIHGSLEEDREMLALDKQLKLHEAGNFNMPPVLLADVTNVMLGSCFVIREEAAIAMGYSDSIVTNHTALLGPLQDRTLNPKP